MSKEKVPKNQIFDKTLRILFENAIKDGEILKPFLESNAKITSMDSVIKNPKEVRIDFVNKIEPSQKPAYVLQVEFQTKIERDFPVRMLEYYQFLYSKHKLEVEQILVYLGKKTDKIIPNEIQHRNLVFRYEVIDLSHIHFDDLMKSNSPSEIVLAILTDFEGKTPNEVLTTIKQKLQKICNDEQELKDNYIYLINLLELRTFENEFKNQIKAMPVGLDYRKGFFYQEAVREGRKAGKEQGRLEGKEQGRLEGKEQGKLEGKKDTYLEIALNMHLMGYSMDDIRKITKMSIKNLQEIFKKNNQD